MPVSSSPHDESAVAAALRAAGCVFAEDEARLLVSAAPTSAELAAMVERRMAGLPLEHVLGWAEFCGLRIAVGPGVFVPRRRSESLARRAVAVAREAADRAPRPSRPVALDLCCGAGALGAALGAELDGAEVHAADIDPAAVRWARRNLAAVGGHVYEGDLYQALPDALRGCFDVIVANAPYVPTGEVALMPAEARVHEAPVALDGGPDGLDVLRRVVAEAPVWLAPGGSLLVEVSGRQAPRLLEAFHASGMTARVDVCEEAGATIVVGAVRGRAAKVSGTLGRQR